MVDSVAWCPVPEIIFRVFGNCQLGVNLGRMQIDYEWVDYKWITKIFYCSLAHRILMCQVPLIRRPEPVRQ